MKGAPSSCTTSIRSRNPTVLIREVPRFLLFDLGLYRRDIEKSQSHRTDQGSSKAGRARSGRSGRACRRNPTVLIREVPTQEVGPVDGRSRQESRNPTVLI